MPATAIDFIPIYSACKLDLYQVIYHSYIEAHVRPSPMTAVCFQAIGTSLKTSLSLSHFFPPSVCQIEYILYFLVRRIDISYHLHLIQQATISSPGTSRPPTIEVVQPISLNTQRYCTLVSGFGTASPRTMQRIRKSELEMSLHVKFLDENIA